MLGLHGSEDEGIAILQDIRQVLAQKLHPQAQALSTKDYL